MDNHENNKNALEKPLFSIEYTNSIDEIEKSMKLMDKHLNFKRNIAFTCVYLVLIVLCIYMIFTDSGTSLSVLALFLCLGFLFNLWYTPALKRKRVLNQLQNMKEEEYRADFYDDKLVIETNFVQDNKNQELDSVEVREEHIDVLKPIKSVYDYSVYTPSFIESEDLFLISLGKHYIHCFPKRCLSDDEIKTLGKYYSDRK